MANLLRLEPPRDVDGDRVEYAATLDLAGRSQRLFWRVPAAWRDAITPWADPFVIGFAFPIMQAGEDVEIVGPVSPSLLANLETFMSIWQRWEPTRYRRARLSSRDEREPPPPAEPDAFVLPFSAGVDSSFTAYRHARGLAGRNTRRLGAGITFHNFDVQSGERNAVGRWVQLRDGAAALLASLSIPAIAVDGNFRSLDQFWQHSHGTQLASGIALFGRRFGGGMVANSTPCERLDRPGRRLGSHPYSDPFLSSDTFPIVDDGATFHRTEKVAILAAWPELRGHLRVCFGAKGNLGNCGRCEKCFRTAVAFRIAGVAPPAGLPVELTARSMRHLRVSGPSIRVWRDLLADLRRAGRSGEGSEAAIRSMLRRSRRHQLLKQIKLPFVPVRNGIRRVFRGSARSRKQLAAETASRQSAIARASDPRDAADDRAASTRS